MCVTGYIRFKIGMVGWKFYYFVRKYREIILPSKEFT